MKRWLANHILSTDDLQIEDTSPVSDKEFLISLSMVSIALAAFGVIIHLFGY